jgi:hypothetical protein
MTYQPFNEYVSYGSQWEIYCAGHGIVLHEVITFPFLPLIPCRMILELREYKPQLIVSLKKASSQILYTPTAHQTLTLRPYKGTS